MEELPDSSCAPRWFSVDSRAVFDIYCVARPDAPDRCHPGLRPLFRWPLRYARCGVVAPFVCDVFQGDSDVGHVVVAAAPSFFPRTWSSCWRPSCSQSLRRTSCNMSVRGNRASEIVWDVISSQPITTARWLPLRPCWLAAVEQSWRCLRMFCVKACQFLSEKHTFCIRGTFWALFVPALFPPCPRPFPSGPAMCRPCSRHVPALFSLWDLFLLEYASIEI